MHIGVHMDQGGTVHDMLSYEEDRSFSEWVEWAKNVGRGNDVLNVRKRHRLHWIGPRGNAEDEDAKEVMIMGEIILLNEIIRSIKWARLLIKICVRHSEKYILPKNGILLPQPFYTSFSEVRFSSRWNADVRPLPGFEVVKGWIESIYYSDLELSWNFLVSHCGFGDYMELERSKGTDCDINLFSLNWNQGQKVERYLRDLPKRSIVSYFLRELMRGEKEFDESVLLERKDLCVVDSRHFIQATFETNCDVLMYG
ncbi:hypothetical protein WUBG_13637 [Wuchereria bancrofti]|uniref:Uncharacterized protein n=1 Tax=Wuchereria bancrofti TaxID=6293 RepID=J9EJ93_WUCBA|nr:hypothetical protein WUBG_13637 [Wuchereria bancrofti]